MAAVDHPTRESPDHREVAGWSGELATLVAGALCLPLFSVLWGRFFGSGASFLAVVVLFPLALFVTLIAAGTLAGDPARVVRRVLRGVGVAERRLGPVAAGCSLAAVALGGLIWISLPWFSSSVTARGLRLADQGRLAEAITELSRAVDLDEGNVEAHYNLAVLLEEVFRVDEAAEHYQLAFAGGLNPAANNLARLLVKEGRLNDATTLLVPLYDNGMSGSGDLGARFGVSVRKNLAWARMLQGREGEAKRILEEAIGMDPELAVLHCILGETLSRLGEREGAVEEWRRCLARSSVLEPDEDAWIGAAKSFLKEHE